MQVGGERVGKIGEWAEPWLHLHNALASTAELARKGKSSAPGTGLVQIAAPTRDQRLMVMSCWECPTETLSAHRGALGPEGVASSVTFNRTTQDLCHLSWRPLTTSPVVATVPLIVAAVLGVGP